MVEEKAPPRKQGLHGWKAAGAVFGCGSLAAFGVFGVLVGVASLFFSTVSEGISGSPEAGINQTGEPIENLEPGEMDLCVQDVQYTHGQYEHGYSSGNYLDPAFDGNKEDRTVSDECSWEITPKGESYVDPWFFSYSYQAVVATSNSEDPYDVASAYFEEFVTDFPVRGYELISSGEADLSERSYFYYGKGSDGGYVYYIAGQTRSTVYVIHFSSPVYNGKITETRFLNEARHVASYVEPGLAVLIPE